MLTWRFALTLFVMAGIVVVVDRPRFRLSSRGERVRDGIAKTLIVVGALVLVASLVT